MQSHATDISLSLSLSHLLSRPRKISNKDKLASAFFSRFFKRSLLSFLYNILYFILYTYIRLENKTKIKYSVRVFYLIIIGENKKIGRIVICILFYSTLLFPPRGPLNLSSLLITCPIPCRYHASPDYHSILTFYACSACFSPCNVTTSFRSFDIRGM